jgi:hypothetical protein
LRSSKPSAEPRRPQRDDAAIPLTTAENIFCGPQKTRSALRMRWLSAVWARCAEAFGSRISLPQMPLGSRTAAEFSNRVSLAKFILKSTS